MKGPRGAIAAWAMYDFANSAFATTVLSVVFNVYFVKVLVPPEGIRLWGVDWTGPALWSGTVSLSMGVTFLLSPLLGAMADSSGRKKRFLTVFWLAGCAASAGLFAAKPGRTALAAGLFLVANMGFAGGNVFYNAMLPDISDRSRMGRVSGWGWAAGYLGGGLCLLANLAMLRAPGAFGLAGDATLPVRACLLSVGFWWFIFGLPMALWGPPDAAGTGPGWREGIRQAWARLLDTFRHARRYGGLGRFLAAYVLYNDGIETVILMASIVGAGLLGMDQDQLVVCFLMIQGVAFLGAMLCGRLADRVGHKPVLLATVLVYAGVTVWGARMQTQAEFWALGAVVGLVLGGSQAASRSLMGLLTPPEKSAEFFSFYGVVGKLSALFGPLVFGAASQAWGLRAAMLSLLFFFIPGGLLLMFVQEPRE